MNANGSGNDGKREPAAPAAGYSPEADRHPSGGQRTRTVEEARNGSMVQDLSDLKRLGADMERVETETRLKKRGLVSDPSQK